MAAVEKVVLLVALTLILSAFVMAGLTGFVASIRLALLAWLLRMFS